jgi:hypothetical protein
LFWSTKWIRSRPLKKRSGGAFLGRSVYGSFAKNVNPTSEMKLFVIGKEVGQTMQKRLQRKRFLQLSVPCGT